MDFPAWPDEALEFEPVPEFGETMQGSRAAPGIRGSQIPGFEPLPESPEFGEVMPGFEPAPGVRGVR